MNYNIGMYTLKYLNQSIDTTSRHHRVLSFLTISLSLGVSKSEQTTSQREFEQTFCENLKIINKLWKKCGRSCGKTLNIINFTGRMGNEWMLEISKPAPFNNSYYGKKKKEIAGTITIMTPKR